MNARSEAGRLSRQDRWRRVSPWRASISRRRGAARFERRLWPRRRRRCAAGRVVLLRLPRRASVGRDAGAAARSAASPAEIVQAMQEFRDGQAPGDVMDRIAKGFTDDEIKAIAAWYAAQKD